MPPLNTVYQTIVKKAIISFLQLFIKIPAGLYCKGSNRRGVAVEKEHGWLLAFYYLHKMCKNNALFNGNIIPFVKALKNNDIFLLTICFIPVY